MTEKRFWSEDYGVGYYTEIVDNEKELEDVPNPKKNLLIEEVIDLLNELAEENQYLRELLDIGKTNAKDIVDVLNVQQNAIKELTKENEYLKKKHKDILKLEKENEELKREMRIKDALSIAKWAKKNIKYGYYDNNSDAHKWLEEERRRALNCSDIDKVDLNKKRR